MLQEPRSPYPWCRVNYRELLLSKEKNENDLIHTMIESSREVLGQHKMFNKVWQLIGSKGA